MSSMKDVAQSVKVDDFKEDQFVAEEEKEKERKCDFQYIMSVWVALAAAGTSIASIALSFVYPWKTLLPHQQGGRVCRYASGVITAAITAPAAVIQGKMMSQGRTFRDHLNNLREEANRFTIENEKLGMNVDELEDQVHRLDDTREALDNLAKAQGHSLNTFMDLIAEHKEITEKMKTVLAARASQDLLSVVLLSDTNNDFQFDDDEIDRLILRLRVTETVHIDEEKFRQELKQNNSVTFVLQMLTNLHHAEEEKSKSRYGRLSFGSKAKKGKSQMSATGSVQPIDPQKFLQRERSIRQGGQKNESERSVRNSWLQGNSTRFGADLKELSVSQGEQENEPENSLRDTWLRSDSTHIEVGLK